MGVEEKPGVVTMAMISSLPDNLQALFTPRPPLEFIPVPERKEYPPYTGIAHLFSQFEQPDKAETKPIDFLHVESREQRTKRIAKQREDKKMRKISEQMADWNPKQKHSGDPFHTLFVARLDYSTTEETLQKEFGTYGPIKSIVLVKHNETGESRGYAFIEFERERDMKSAYKYADGLRVDNRRIVVDMERGRTVSSFKPRRLGGGMGDTRKTKLKKQTRPPVGPPPRRFGGGGGGGGGGGRFDRGGGRPYDRGGRDSYRPPGGGSQRGPGRPRDSFGRGGGGGGGGPRDRRDFGGGGGHGGHG